MSAWSEDLLKRKGVSTFLESYLDGNPDVRVLNVNAEWGAGKTFFLENWRAASADDRASVYFNAWETDYTGDPFISLVAALHDQLSKQLPASAAVTRELGEFTTSAAKAIVTATPKVLSGLARKVIGEGAVDALVEGVLDVVEDATEAAVKALIEGHEEAARDVANFKNVLGSLIQRVSEAKQESKPVYIFIDELDRCRPTYAIELLERLKHFFDVDGCRFIVATDTRQLSSSVCAVYGESFNSSEYLKRFFDAEYTLGAPSLELWVEKRAVFLQRPYGYEDLPIFVHESSARQNRYGNPTIIVSPDADTFFCPKLSKQQLLLLVTSKAFNVSLRQLDKCLRQINAIKKFLDGQSFEGFWCTYLVILKDAAPVEFEKMFRRQFRAEDVQALERKFISGKVFTGAGSLTVHKLASQYYSMLVASDDARSSEINSQRDQVLSTIAWRFLNGNDREMARYFDYVALAHSLE